MTELETAITGIFTDVMSLFTGPIVAGVALVVAASVGLTWAIRKVRQNAR